MRNRALQVRMVKTDALTGVGAPEVPAIDPAAINIMVAEQVQNIAMTVGTVLLVKKAADTLSELILIAGRKYI